MVGVRNVIESVLLTLNVLILLIICEPSVLLISMMMWYALMRTHARTLRECMMLYAHTLSRHRAKNNYRKM